MSRSKLQFLIGNHFLVILLSDKLLLLFYLLQLLVLISPAHQLREHLRIVIINILIYSRLQPLHQLLLNPVLNIRSDQRLRLSNAIPPLSFLFYGNNFLFTLKLQLTHLNEHLPKLGQALLAFVDLEGRPIDQILIDLLECLRIALVQPHLLPKLTGQMRPLRSFHK